MYYEQYFANRLLGQSRLSGHTLQCILPSRGRKHPADRLGGYLCRMSDRFCGRHRADHSGVQTGFHHQKSPVVYRKTDSEHLRGSIPRNTYDRPGDFGAMQYLGITMGMWFAAFFIVSINTGAYMAETVRGGILSIDPGQTEGAKAIGMTHFQTMLYVIFPQTLRNIIPQIGNNLIINIKDSSVLSVIGVIELYYAAKQTAGAYYWWFEAMTVAMVLYLIMTFVFSRLLRFWESKLDGPASFDLATTDQLAHTSGNYSYPGEGSFDKERNIETDVNGGRDK